MVPAARYYGDPARLHRLTDAFNAAARNEAEKRAFTWIDVGPASRKGLGTSGWISADDLHPGDAQYAAWAEEIWARVGPDWARLD